MRNTMILLLVIAFCIGAGCGNPVDQFVSSQTNSNVNASIGVGVVSGFITDTSGAPILGVSVRMGNSSCSSISDGSYTLTDLTAGTGQTITAQLAGFQSYTTVIDVLAGSTTNYNIVMSATPQDSGSVTGVVTDANTGSVLSGVIVTIDSWSSYTDLGGNYALYGIPSGAGKTITASRSGYVNYSGTVDVNANATATKDFSMGK